MSFSDLYNFSELTTELHVHDWVKRQSVALIGPPNSGKTRVIERFVESLTINGHYVVLIDSRSVKTRWQVLEQAINAAEDHELVSARARLASQGHAILINNSTVDRSRISYRAGRRRWWPWRRSSADRSNGPDGMDLIQTLLDGIDRMSRRGWIVVDNVGRASDEIRELVQIVEKRLRLSAGLRLLVVETHGFVSTAVPKAISTSATVYRIGELTVDDVRNWAARVGLDITAENARMLHTLASGHSGSIFDSLAILWAKQYRADQEQVA